MDDERDEHGSESSSESKRRLPGTGMTRAELEHARRIAQDGWRVMDFIDQSTLDRINDAADAAKYVHRELDSQSLAQRYADLMPRLDTAIPDGLLSSTGIAQSIAERFASTQDVGALARLAMSSTVSDNLAESMRLWGQALPENSALNEMIKQVGESTSHLFAGQNLASTAAIASLGESLSGWGQSQALRDLAQSTTLASGFFASEGNALDALIEHSSLYTQGLFESAGISGALESLTRQSTAGAFASLFDSPVYAGLRSSLHDDAAFAGLHSLMEQTDLSSIASLAERALGGVSLGSLEAAAARLASLDPDLDEDGFEDAAIEVLREIDEDYDPDLPPTPEDMAATEAFVRLLIALRPDLSDDPELRKRVKWVTRGGGALVGVYLLAFHAPVFAALGALLIILDIAKYTGDATDRLLSPTAHDVEEGD